MTEKRNMAMAVPMASKMPAPVWTDWNTAKAVKEGYKVSGWVFKAVSLISRNISSVPWKVVDKNGKEIEGHPISILLAKPNNEFSRQTFFELLSSWQQLSGMGYIKKVTVNNQIVELWPISPDRLRPVASTESTKLLAYYEQLTSSGTYIKSVDYTEENVIPFLFIDPANPLVGVGPLQVAARAVDVDVEQQKWNKSAMQNKGMLEGIFSFKRDLDPTMYSTIKEKLKEMFAGSENARDIGVIGSEATYQRLSLTPAEMDFITSRRFNREEIYAIFGIPPQLAGSEESATYNNFSTAMRIFWELTLLPIMDDIKDTLNHYLADELGEYILEYDTSKIKALKQDQKEQAEAAKIYSDMGVPMKTINEYMSLGIPEYDGWDKPVVRSSAPVKTEARGIQLKKSENRSIESDEKLRVKLEDRHTSLFTEALVVQQEKVFEALQAGTDTTGAILNTRQLMVDALETTYTNTAYTFAGTVLVDERGIDIDFEKRKIDYNLAGLIDQFLEEEGVILLDLSLIEKTTIDGILTAVLDGEEEGKSINEIQQSLIDVGLFSSERALRIARTTVGTAQSIGQVEGARSAGATKKTWHDSGFEVRSIHKARNGETVGMDEQFSSQVTGATSPRWPLDQRSAASDRINCRCFMTFS